MYIVLLFVFDALHLSITAERALLLLLLSILAKRGSRLSWINILNIFRVDTFYFWFTDISRVFANGVLISKHTHSSIESSAEYI